MQPLSDSRNGSKRKFPLNLAFFGPPGSGKGTQSEKLMMLHPFAHVSTGDLLRAERDSGSPLGKKIGEIIGRGQLVSDDVVGELLMKELRELIPQGRGILFDGYPRNLAQLRNLEKILEQLGTELHLAISLEVDDENLTERLTSRRVCTECKRVYNILTKPPRVMDTCDACGGKLFHRVDDRPETIKQRLADYHRLTEPILEDLEARKKLIRVNGDQPIDEIHKELKIIIASRREQVAAS